MVFLIPCFALILNILGSLANLAATIVPDTSSEFFCTGNELSLIFFAWLWRYIPGALILTPHGQRNFSFEGCTFFFRSLRFNLAGITSFFLSLYVEILPLLRHRSWKFLLLILAVRLQVEKLQDLFYYFRLWYRKLTSVKFVLFHLLLYPFPKV